MFSKVLIVLAITSAAFANVFITAPIASTSFASGQPATIKWQDSGSAPSLKDFGPAIISIYAGNAQQQTRLQTLSPSTDVSVDSDLEFIPDATIGPDSSEYFIRIESIALKDTAQPQFPALAFSAKFSLTGMTGVFTADVLNQIKGQSTAPLNSPGPAATGNTTPTPSPTSSSNTSKKTTSTPTPSPSPSAGAASALKGKIGWAGAALGAVVGAIMF